MDFRFSDDFLKALEYSVHEAMRTGWRNIGPDHIMLGILRHYNNDACHALYVLGIDTVQFKEGIDAALFADDGVPWSELDSIFPNESAVSMLQHSALEAARCKDTELCPLHFLLACIRSEGSYSHSWLSSYGVSLKAVVEAAGIKWENYGLAAQPEETSNTSFVVDAEAFAEAMEKRIREGYTTDNTLAS